MSASQFPPPPIPRIDGRQLGKPPRSMFIRCAMADFGLTQAQAEAMVDRAINDLDLDVDVVR